jgi:hypothetical protein
MTAFLQRRASPGSLLKGDPMKKAPKPAKDDAAKVAKDHLAWIHELPCLITGKMGVEAAHISYASKIWAKPDRGMGRKADDRWTVPLCTNAHAEQHAMGERAFWKKYGIDPLVVACRLWEASGDTKQGKAVVQDARAVMKGGE